MAQGIVNVPGNVLIKAKEYTDAAVAELSERVDAIENSLTAYGLRWVTGASDPTGERCVMIGDIMYTGDDTGLSFTVNSDGSFTSSYSDLPIWGEIVRETVESQVMVRVPKYYVKQEDADDGYSYIWVCKVKKDGYRCAGMFLDADDNEHDYYYMGAYEMTADAATLGKSVSGATYGDTYNAGYTITQYREAAQAIGDGWGITTIAEVCDFWQILVPIEFGTRDVQNIAVGVGAIDPLSTDMQTRIYRTGDCDSVANNHGIAYLYEDVVDGSNYNYNGSGLYSGANPFVYRGIENPWGACAKHVDGLLNIKNVWYASNDRDNFSATSASGYTALTYTAPTEGGYSSSTYSEGYVKHLVNLEDQGAAYVTLPDELEDEISGTYYSDCFWASLSSSTVYHPVFGGDPYGVLYGYGGAFSLYVYYSAADALACYGARLSYLPE